MKRFSYRMGRFEFLYDVDVTEPYDNKGYTFELDLLAVYIEAPNLYLDQLEAPEIDALDCEKVHDLAFKQFRTELVTKNTS